MMKKINYTLRGVLFVFLIFFSVQVFSHEAAVKIEGENLYKAVRVTQPVYNAAQKNLSDILIKDEKGENVPYFINSSFEKKDSAKETFLMSLINSYTKDDFFYFDYKLAFPRDSDIIATSLEFSTNNTGFAKRVEVSGGYDNIHWEFVQSDILYVVEDKTKLAINFNQPQKYTHYRLRLANNMERISFTQASLVFNREKEEETYFIENFSAKFTVEEEERRTKILIEGLKNLKLFDISIETDSMFIRPVNAYGGVKKELYNLSVNGTSYTDTALPLNRLVSQDETFEVFINNGDDKPIDITGITVRFFADDLVFKAEGSGIYTLDFAEASRPAPVYDIQRYKADILKGPVDRLVLGEITYAPTEPEQKEIPLKIIFNVVVILIALLLGVLIILKLKKQAGEKAAEY